MNGEEWNEMHNCNDGRNGFGWESHPELYSYGSIEELWKQDPLGSTFIQGFLGDYIDRLGFCYWVYGEHDMTRLREHVKLFFVRDHPKYKVKFFGLPKDILCGVKTGRITTRMISNYQTGGNNHISPTEKFYDICVSPVALRFKFTEFHDPEVVKQNAIRH